MTQPLRIILFTDIASGEYYDNAVLWAVANGVTNGVGEGHLHQRSDRDLPVPGYDRIIPKQ